MRLHKIEEGFMKGNILYHNLGYFINLVKKDPNEVVA